MALVAWQGFDTVGQSVLAVGWGLLAVVAYRAVPVSADGLAWRFVLGRDWRESPIPLLVIRWIRDSINILLPVGQIGGDVAGARLLTFRNIPAGVAGASILVDKTLEIVAQVIFILTGLALLMAGGQTGGLVRGAAIGALAMLAVVAAFVVAQWIGLGRVIEAMARRLCHLLGRAGGGMAGLDDTVHAYYRDPSRVLGGVGLHLAGWLSGALDVWLILHFMGHSIGLGGCLIVESIGQAVRSAGFAVPAAAGVQEAGYMAVATLVGLPPEAGLALSLVKRLRHVIAGLPAILLWQGLEGRRWLSRPGREAPGE